jgi:hypothetical protein
MKNRIDMPTKLSVKLYWHEWLYLKGKVPFRWDQKAIDYCFACGIEAVTERCHIVAHSKTQNNNVNNIHLLCRSCHEESENMMGKMYWDWLKAKNVDMALIEQENRKFSNLKLIANELRKLNDFENMSRTKIFDFLKKYIHG